MCLQLQYGDRMHGSPRVWAHLSQSLFRWYRRYRPLRAARVRRTDRPFESEGNIWPSGSGKFPKPMATPQASFPGSVVSRFTSEVHRSRDRGGLDQERDRGHTTITDVPDWARSDHQSFVLMSGSPAGELHLPTSSWYGVTQLVPEFVFAFRGDPAGPRPPVRF